MLGYRIEHSGTRKGPWSHRDWLYGDYDLTLYRGHPCPQDMPIPSDDGIHTRPDGYRCAFRTLKLLAYWFRRRNRRILARNGFVLSVYEFPEASAVVGGVQLLFVIDDARLVRERSLLFTRA